MKKTNLESLEKFLNKLFSFNNKVLGGNSVKMGKWVGKNYTDSVNKKSL